jgi:LysR family hydrogen peroxide-inducible transcriptional activator
VLQERYPELDMTLHEARTDSLLASLADGTLDTALLALPAGDERFESLPLFGDIFLLAMPAGTEVPDGIGTQDLRADSLILLEEGHCLRDQALAACGSVAPRTMSKFGATSLTTVMQMVAGGYGSTLVPEMAVASEVTGNDRLQLLRFRDPQPSRTVGLLWRATAPRKDQYRRLGAVLTEIWQAGRALAA